MDRMRNQNFMQPLGGGFLGQDSDGYCEYLFILPLLFHIAHLSNPLLQRIRYTYGFTPTILGQWTLHVTLCNENISQAPFTFEVREPTAVDSEIRTRVVEYMVLYQKGDTQQCSCVINCSRSLAKEVDDGSFNFEMLESGRHSNNKPNYNGHHYLLLNAIATRESWQSHYRGEDMTYLAAVMAQAFYSLPLLQFTEIAKDFLHYIKTEQVTLGLINALKVKWQGGLALVYKGKYYFVPNGAIGRFTQISIIIFGDDGKFVEFGQGDLMSFKEDEWITDTSGLPRYFDTGFVEINTN